MKMLTRCKEILIAVFLGLVCPALLITMLQNGQTDIQPTMTNSTVGNYEPKTLPLQISVLMKDGSVTTMDMNDYLTCVVLREMPASFEAEALKAQAVVARTYALRRCVSGGKHTDAAVCTNSDCCQGYCDIEEYLADAGNHEDIEKVKDAVNMTDAMVLVYDGELIDATYFSCSGGLTEDAKAVWGSDIPYLRSTQSPGEENAKYYVDTATFDAAEFLERLEIDPELSNHLQISNITYTNGGGVETIDICGVRLKGTELRNKLALRSTAFAISAVGDTVTVTTKGFGHRVGMSQYGADAMAVGGATFCDILAHYYQGTQLVTYQGN